MRASQNIARIAIAAIVLISAAAQSGTAFADKAPAPKDRLEPYGGFELAQGRQRFVCRQIEKNLARYSLLPRHLCALPLNGTDGFLRPKWEPVDPTTNLDVVKQLAVWSRYAFSPEHGKELQYAKNPTSVVERLWPPLAQKTMEKIAQGELVLEKAEFDMDGDGKSDIVYRQGDAEQAEIAPVLRDSTGRLLIEWKDSGPNRYPHPRIDLSNRVKGDICQPPVIDGAKRLYRYFVRQEDNEVLYESLRSRTLDTYDLFSYRGHIYLGITGTPGISVYETKPGPGAGTAIHISVEMVCLLNFQLAE